MGSYYRESSNKAKLVKEGILDARPVSKGQKNKTKDWLLVIIRGKDLCTNPTISERCYVGTIEIYGEYAREDIAYSAIPYRDPVIYSNSTLLHWTGAVYVVSRKLYEEIYQPLWKSLLMVDKNRFIREKGNGLDCNA